MLMIAVDPGAMCGVASNVAHNSILFYRELPPFETVSWVEDQLRRLPADVIADLTAERYTMTRQHHTQQPEALEVIGALRYLSRKYPRVRFTLQSRSVKSKVTNDVLRELDWYPLGDHARDATRHLVVRQVTLGILGSDAMRRLAGTMVSTKK